MKITAAKIKSYFNKYGAVKLCGKAIEKVANRENYNVLRLLEIAADDELSAQREYNFAVKPLISILMPVYNTGHKALGQALKSVYNQSYDNWQLCIADGGSRKVNDVVRKIFGDDERVTYVCLEENLGISENTNQALAVAKGDYVAFLDHDDVLEPDALFETVRKIVENNADMVYTDEDKVDAGLENYFRPYRKPDFNKTLLLSNNYICHFCTIKKQIVEKAGGFRSEYDGAQDYDLFLRCIDYCNNIEHVARVLYHWRVGDNSTSDNPFNKEYAFDAGRRALEDYMRNTLPDTEVSVKELDDPGYYRIVLHKELEYSCITSFPEYDGSDDGIAELCGDYVLLLKTNMKLSDNFVRDAVTRAHLTDADIVVPKITANGFYLYNGIAKAGKKHTQSLKGKPSWFKGLFNLAAVDMEVNAVPKYGILVKKPALSAVLAVRGAHISNLKGPAKGLKMVYAPEITIKM